MLFIYSMDTWIYGIIGCLVLFSLFIVPNSKCSGILKTNAIDHSKIVKMVSHLKEIKEFVDFDIDSIPGLAKYYKIISCKYEKGLSLNVYEKAVLFKIEISNFLNFNNSHKNRYRGKSQFITELFMDDQSIIGSKEYRDVSTNIESYYKEYGDDLTYSHVSRNLGHYKHKNYKKTVFQSSRIKVAFINKKFGNENKKESLLTLATQLSQVINITNIKNRKEINENKKKLAKSHRTLTRSLEKEYRYRN